GDPCGGCAVLRGSRLRRAARRGGTDRFAAPSQRAGGGLVLVLCATAAVAAGTDRERARRAGEHRSGCRRARVRQARAAGRTCRAAGEIAWGPGAATFTPVPTDAHG